MDINSVVNYLTTHILQIGIAALMAYIAFKVKGMICLQSTVMILLKDRLYQACRYYLDKGYCSTQDREILQMMYDDYHNDYKQNGVVQDLFEKVLELPHRKESEK